MKRTPKPQLISAYNHSLLFYSIHFSASGPPKGCPKDVWPKYVSMNIQEALLLIIQTLNNARNEVGDPSGLTDIAEKEVVAALISYRGAARSFLKWSSTWANFVRPKIRPAGSGGLILSPGELAGDHEILCVESADRFEASWEVFAFWYTNLRYDTDAIAGYWLRPSEN